jgi:hypothetical protein
MGTFFRSTAIVLAAAISVGTASFGAMANPADTSGHQQVFKAGRGVSLDVGASKVVGYYLAGDGVCNLTMIMADLPDSDGKVSGTSTRLNVPVKAGTKSQVYTREGRTMEVSCAVAAHLMTIRTLDVTALVVPR